MAILPYKGVTPTIEDNVFIAPGAMVIGNVTIREGASIWYNTVIRADSAPIVIGRHTNIQDNCTLHVDEDAPLIIGDQCTIGHGAIIHGATLGDQVLVGMQAVVLSHARVGSKSMIGACALIGEHKDVPEGVLMLGIPAKYVRGLAEAELENLVTSAEDYYERAQNHKKLIE
jgi:carbonic anhydrase/acetyltransferase-like protein (isoleucine patch superfamily)